MKASRIAYVVLNDERQVVSCHASFAAAVAAAKASDAGSYVRPASVEAVPDNDHGDGAIETGQAWRADLAELDGVDDDCNTDDTDDLYRLRVEFGNGNAFARAGA